MESVNVVVEVEQLKTKMVARIYIDDRLNKTIEAPYIAKNESQVKASLYEASKMYAITYTSVTRMTMRTLKYTTKTKGGRSK